ncbi:hypothetical protein J1614_004179 [Plenodomus biglobosus]|nr:hypothetical protein J1614_004179 [Plenodomus biglobosus]
MAASGNQLPSSHQLAHLDGISQENRRSSRFLRLPPEVRNQIYDLLLADCAAAQILPANTFRAVAPPHHRTKLHGLSLLFICRQTRSEATSIFCTHTVFDFTLFKHNEEPFPRMIALVGNDKCHLIQKLHVHWSTLYLLRDFSSVPGRAPAAHLMVPSLRFVYISVPKHQDRGMFFCAGQRMNYLGNTIGMRNYFGAPNLRVHYLRLLDSWWD